MKRFNDTLSAVLLLSNFDHADKISGGVTLLQTGQCDASMAGVREVGTVERAERTYGGAAVGEEKKRRCAICNMKSMAHQGRGIVEDQSLSANTVFRSAMTAS